MARMKAVLKSTFDLQISCLCRPMHHQPFNSFLPCFEAVKHNCKSTVFVADGVEQPWFGIKQKIEAQRFYSVSSGYFLWLEGFLHSKPERKVFHFQCN